MVDVSVGKVGLVTDAVEEAGSTDGMLELIDIRDGFVAREVHLGGEIGEVGL